MRRGFEKKGEGEEREKRRLGGSGKEGEGEEEGKKGGLKGAARKEKRREKER